MGASPTNNGKADVAATRVAVPSIKSPGAKSAPVRTALLPWLGILVVELLELLGLSIGKSVEGSTTSSFW